MVTKEKISQNYDDIVRIARKAGDAIMGIYSSTDFDVTVKEDQSPLTKADRISHQIICEELAKYNIPVLSEEGAAIDYEERSKWNLFWLIDPIDGTKEFIKRNGEFTVNIALIEDNKPVFGVVGVPVYNDIYVGGENFPGIIINEDKKELFPKHKNTCNNIVVASKSHLNSATTDYIDTLKTPELIQVGSSLKFMMLAQNKASIYPRFAPTMEWDIGASHAILKSLGYNILDPLGKELRYNKEDLMNPYFIAK